MKITPENYLEFKPSELVRSFLTDIEIAEKIGKPMNMSRFDAGKNEDCLPCLGGMKCLNWNVDVFSEGYQGSTAEAQIISDIADLGDYIRIGHGSGIRYALKSLYKSFHFCELPDFPKISGIVEVKDFGKLKDRINTYAKCLEFAGQ